MKKWTVAVIALALALTAVPALAGDGEDGAEWNWFGEFRARPEYNENLSDLAAGLDDKIGYIAYRMNLGFDVELDKNVHIRVDGQFMGQFGEDWTAQRGALAYPTTSSYFSLFEGYVDMRNMFDTPFSLKIGRQKVVFADEWLFGDYDFYGGTSHDGLVGTFDSDLVTVTPFWVKNIEADVPEWNSFGLQDTQGDFDIYAVWTAWNLPGEQKLDTGVVYGLDRFKTTSLPFTDKRWTYAAQYHYGAPTGLYVDVNGAIQWGTTVDFAATKQDVDADAIEATLGWGFERGGGQYKIWARFANYSGDDTSTADVEAFNPLFQDNHGRYGLLDIWNGQWGFTQYLGSEGIQFQQLGWDAKLANGIGIRGIAQRMRRTTEKSPTLTNRNLGEEYGFEVTYDYGDNVHLALGLAQLYPGAAISYEPPQFTRSTVRRFYLNTVTRF